MLFSSISVAASGLNAETDANQNSPVKSSYSQTFPDIEGHWCKEYIEKFLSKKWVVGYDDGLFRPDRFVTRAEFTAMVVNIFKKVESVNECNFSDVKKSDWFYNAVAYAAAEGLIQGYENGTFKPRDNMSRQDAAVLVAKLFDVSFFEGAQDYKFADEDTFPEYSYKSIKNLASHEIVQGYPDGTFRPTRLITRAEAVRMLDVVLKYIEVPEETIPVAPQTPTPTYTPAATPTAIPTSTPNTGNNKPDPGPASTPKVTVAPTEIPRIHRIYTDDEDFNEGTKINLTNEVSGQLKLDDTTKPFNFIWVAVSTKGTVVKIDTDTGKVVGEYRTAPQGQPTNPSRTTVDHNGNVWVANRDGNSVVRIGLAENGQWIDKNGNGVCDTSTGLGDIRPWSNAGGADTNGGVSTAEDECIINYVKVSSSGTRHVSVDSNNDVWVSGTGNRIFNLIDGETGEIKRTEGPV